MDAQWDLPDSHRRTLVPDQRGWSTTPSSQTRFAAKIYKLFHYLPLTILRVAVDCLIGEAIESFPVLSFTPD